MNIEFTLEQLSILDRALQQMPYGLVAPLIHSINTQLAAQQKVMDTPITEGLVVNEPEFKTRKH